MSITSKDLARQKNISTVAIWKKRKKAEEQGLNYFEIDDEIVMFNIVRGVGGRGEVAEFEIIKKAIAKETDEQRDNQRADSGTPRKGDRSSTGRGKCDSRQNDRQNNTTASTAKTELNRLSETELKKATQRAKICIEYLKKDRSMKIEAFLESVYVEHGVRMTRATLLRLVKLYADAINAGQDGVLAVADRRGRPKGDTKLSAKHKEAILCYMVRRDIRPTKEAIYRNLEALFDDIPSRDTVMRYMERLESSERLLLSIARHPDKAKNELMPAFGSRSEKAMYRNHYWELDGTTADVVTSDGKRWAIVALIDVYSRRVAVNLEEKSSSFAIARNLRNGLLKLGIPENIIIDNGKDYTSNHMESCFLSMGINAIKTPPYSGEYKPHIERFFGTMARELFRELEGFVGHSVSEREAIKAGLSYADRLEAIKRWREKQKSDTEFAKLWKKSDKYAGLEIEIPLTTEELKNAINAYVTHYENRVHSGIGMTPKMRYESSERAVTMVMDNRSLDFLLGESKWYTVGKDGIRVREDGVSFEYASVELFEYVGQKVRVIKLDELGEIAVYREDNTFLCLACDPSVKGESREQFKDASKKWKKAAREAEKQIAIKTKIARELHPTIRDRLDIETEAIAPKNIETVAQEEVCDSESKYITSPLEAFLRAIKDGKDKEERIEKLKAKYPDIWEMAVKRSA